MQRPEAWVTCRGVEQAPHFDLSGITRVRAHGTSAVRVLQGSTYPKLNVRHIPLAHRNPIKVFSVHSQGLVFKSWGNLNNYPWRLVCIPSDWFSFPEVGFQLESLVFIPRGWFSPTR